jgi:hypothetical protein
MVRRSGLLPVSLSGPIANPTTRQKSFLTLMNSKTNRQRGRDPPVYCNLLSSCDRTSEQKSRCPVSKQHPLFLCRIPRAHCPVNRFKQITPKESMHHGLATISTSDLNTSSSSDILHTLIRLYALAHSPSTHYLDTVHLDTTG